MANVEVKAPSNIKISGEHSVVYGGPCLSAAIPIYATASVKDNSTGELDIFLSDLDLRASFNDQTLRALHAEYSKRDVTPKKVGDTSPTGLAKFIANHKEIAKDMLPYAVIASRLLVEHDVSVINKEIIIHSDVPIGKGYASSAVCATSFTVALIKSAMKILDDPTIIDISRDGERIAHQIETGGRLDVGPIYLGGYVTYDHDNGTKQQSISAQIKVVILDVGEKPPTAVQLAKVRDRRASDPEDTDMIFGEIDACVLQCVSALKNGDIEQLGKQMSRNHELLKKLGVSSDKLDLAVNLAVSNGAYGAKLCGGGGGGMGIALVKDDVTAKKVINALKEHGFIGFETSVTLNGAKHYLK